MAKKSVSNQPDVEQPAKQELHGLIVTAPFELERNYKMVQYGIGEKFNVPDGWTRDADFEEFSKISLKNSPKGIPFQVPAPILDEKGKLKYMESRRVVLPLKEV